MMRYLTVEQLEHLHQRIVAASGGLPGVRDPNAFEAIPTRLRLSAKGQEVFDDIFTKAALLLSLIVEGQPCHDGNKRLGIAAASVFLMLNGQDLAASDHEIVDFCRAVERGSLDRPTIAEWLKRKTAQVV